MKVREQDVENLKKLPEWVKCCYCGGKPTETDWLGELMRHTNMLAHQSCAKARGKVFGLNAGTIQEVGATIKSTED